MKNRLIPMLVLTIITACSSPENGWIELTGDNEFEGWEILGGEASYEVINGEIVGTTKGSTNTFLATETLYDDFILELEVFVDPRMNSGIQFRSAQNDKGRVYGYQAEIDPSERKWSGGLYDESRRGWLYPLSLNVEGQKAFKNNTWNKYRIEAVGSSIRIWVNDICTTYAEDDVSSTGFIALQVHGVGTAEEEDRQVKWRNIRLMTTDLEQEMLPVPSTVHHLIQAEN
ncbi:MAG: hypothetical protein ACJAVN_001965 [Roseivirga sp.]|jgi:hypothetical protein